MATSKIAADAVVLAEDVAEEFTEQAAEVVTVMKNNPFLLAGVAVLGLSAGGFAGYKFAEKRLKTKYQDALQEELDATRKFYKTGPFDSAGDAAGELLDNLLDEMRAEYKATEEPVEEVKRIVRNYNKPVIVETIVGDTAEPHNVFVDGLPLVGEDWDDDEEVDSTGRNETDPYLISFNEFHNPDPNTTQLALTYYQLDDTLADENDQTVDNVEATIGVDNLDAIRKGTKETTFVRNPRTEMDFEVARYNRSYAKTVLGLGDDG